LRLIVIAIAAFVAVYRAGVLLNNAREMRESLAKIEAHLRVMRRHYESPSVEEPLPKPLTLDDEPLAR
jgi:hypothetical protein